MAKKFPIVLSLMIPFFGCLGCTDDSNNQPPTVVITGAPGEIFVVGEEMNVQIDAQDPEGGALEFSFDWKPKEHPWTIGDRAEILPFSNTALFSWDPLASDATSSDPIQMIFIVKDEAGKVTEKTVTTKIVPGNGQPVFQSNVSEIYDPRTGRPLIFTVKVTDQDSAEVDITMDESTAPPRSMFTKTGAYEGQFTWEPTADQLEQRIRTVRFIANDQENPEVPFDVTIVVRSKGAIRLDKDQTKEECPGEAIISHTPLGPQRSLIEPYVISAELDNAERFDKIVTFWTYADAYNADFDPEDEERQLNAIEMTRDVDGSFRAEIPNQAEIIQNEVLTISYQICAFDNDAAGDAAIVCAPSTGELELFYTFTAYLPEADPCVEDGVDKLVGNDDENSAQTAEDSWEYYRVCDRNPDFHTVTSRPGDSGFIGITFNRGSNIAFNVSSDNGPVELEESSCTGLVTLDTTVEENGSTTKFYIEALGDNVEYQVRYFPIAGGPGGCTDEALEPNETAFDAHEVQSAAAFGAEICDSDDIDIYKIDLNAGDQITVTNTFVNQEGNLDMTLFSPDQSNDITPSANGVALTFTLDDTEMLTHDATMTGSYYLLVFNNNETQVPYNISFDVVAAPPCPDNDQFSSVAPGNHTQDNAALFMSQDTLDLDLEVCPGQDDWYARTEFVGAQLLGALSINNGVGTLGDVTWEVLDNGGTVLETATVVGQELEMFFVPAASGFFYHRISAPNRTEYHITLLR